MRSERVPIKLSGLLRECYLRPHRHCVRNVRRYSTPNDTKDIAILGGGITGLSAAYFAAKNPADRITLYEASSKLGGWLQSSSVDVGNGKVIFEQGPRTLRNKGVQGAITAELVREKLLSIDV